MANSSYLDTSFLLKAYVPEQGSNFVTSLVMSGVPSVVSSFTDLEIFSALHRKLDPLEAVSAIAIYNADRRAGLFYEVAFTPSVVTLAQQLSFQLSGSLLLRSLDLLHLAFATMYGVSTLATFDERLAQGAEALGLAVIGARP